MKRKPTAAPPTPNVPALLKALAARIREWRELHSMTQADLAAKSGISASYVSEIERAERSPSYETLYAIARGLEIPASELFRAEQEPSADDGYYRMLVDFARDLRLSRRQVEQLTTVARAMYGQRGGR